MNAAFLSYNAIPGFNAGWHGDQGNRALVIPNSRGQEFAALFSGAEGNRAVESEITTLWKKLKESLSELDQIVIYVGTDGSEVAIKLASELPAEKVTYVLCDCGLSGKRALIAELGHSDARQIICECRGMSTMSRLARGFLTTGQVS